MRSTTQVVITALIIGLWTGVVFAGGSGWGGFGKKSKSGTTQPDAAGTAATTQPDAGKPATTQPNGSSKGETSTVDSAGKGSEALISEPARTSGDVERVLADLQSLRERQVISDEEYRRYRRQVLDDFVRLPSPR